MRVFNADQRLRLLGAVTRLYLSTVGDDDVIYDHPEPADCGTGAWYPVRLFVRYDEAGMPSVEEIVRDFYATWCDHVHQDLVMNGGDVVDSVADFIRALDGSGEMGAK